MRKLLLALIMIFCGITLSHAQSCIYGNAGCPGIGSITTVQGGGLGSTPIITTQTYTSATSITSNITTQPLPRAVWIGTSQSDDFYINGAWVTFKGATAGTIIYISPTGARLTAGGANPTAGDIVFLY